MDYIVILIAFLIALNIYASFRVLRSIEFENAQKLFQIIVIWLLPLIGAALILLFIKDDHTPKGPRNPNDGQGVDGMPGGVQ
ncbi:MAG: hypothetical protein N0E58_16765 [Candidatus Thiodiazotropha endolucinida]|uniref:Uncharacterized protein n=1 Tax=Candidatus Thiodiazotropha taylori TaxID=2792791 RepID=A0A9E4NM25_9GAMM|nr:hypothetical protein [Candidatus Thiodiazotropha taylori]MCW4237901.1 hypothetical protein [Candidatus Thiodiazotropha endolucinida]